MDTKDDAFIELAMAKLCPHSETTTSHIFRNKNGQTHLHYLCPECLNIVKLKHIELRIISKKMDEILLGIKHLVAAKDKEELKETIITK